MAYSLVQPSLSLEDLNSSSGSGDEHSEYLIPSTPPSGKRVPRQLFTSDILGHIGDRRRDDDVPRWCTDPPYSSTPKSSSSKSSSKSASRKEGSALSLATSSTHSREGSYSGSTILDFSAAGSCHSENGNNSTIGSIASPSSSMQSSATNGQCKQ